MNEELKVIITAETEKLRKETEKAKKQVKSFSQRVKDSAEDARKGWQSVGKAILNGIKTGITGAVKAVKEGVKVMAGAIASLGAALVGVIEGTEEYRINQGKLNTAFEASGMSASYATSTYKGLYRVLGDDGQAVEASTHLAKLTDNAYELGQWTDICTGVYATFGDSLPIESLTEAANETAKTGVVTGGLADALNWAGISEEEFQAKLDACNNEQERERLIRQTLNGVYGEAAELYEKNNEALLKQRDAQMRLQSAFAALGAVLAPIKTAFMELAADALEYVMPYVVAFADTYGPKIVPFIKDLAETYLPVLKEALGKVGEYIGIVIAYITDNWDLILTIAGVIGLITAAIALQNTVMAVRAAMAAAEVATVWGLVSAWIAHAAAVIAAIAPYLLIAVAIAALVAGIWWLVENFEVVKQFFIDFWEGIKNEMEVAKRSWAVLCEGVSAFFALAWEKIVECWNVVVDFFVGIWEGIKTAFSTVGETLGGFFATAWITIKSIWSVVISYFTNIWNTIKSIFSVVGSVLSGNFSEAWEAIKGIFSGWGEFFTGLWNTIVTVFSSIGSAIGNAITNTVKTAINGVLSTAVGIINGFIGAINIAIGVINAIPGVSISKLTPLTAPALAKGGIVDSATLAVVGEAGAEAVVPLENNLEWLDKLSGMLAERMGTSQPVVLEVDGKVFAQTSINAINHLTKQTGKLALNIY